MESVGIKSTGGCWIGWFPQCRKIHFIICYHCSEEYAEIMKMLLEMQYFKEQKNEKTPHCKTPYTYITSSYLKKKYELPQINNSDKQVKEVYSAIEKEQQKYYDRGY